MGLRSIATTGGGADFFKEAEGQFHKLTAMLKSKDTKGMKFSDLEKLINEEGRELLKQLLQGKIDSLGDGFVGKMLEGYDDVRRTHLRIGERQIKSIFGEIELRRIGYGQRYTESLFPKDSALNMPKNSFSHELQRRVCFEVIKGSFDEAVEAINQNIGVPIPKQQVEHITVQCAQDFDAFYSADSIKAEMSEAENKPIIALSMDAKGIVMRRESLRESTRKKADNAEPKLQKRVSPGEKTNRKRMATVAAVYNIDRFERTPDDFRRELKKLEVADDKPRPRPIAKRVWASVAKEPETVTKEIFREALSRDPNQEKEWVALVDGCPHQIERIQNQASERNLKLTVVCDIIHVIEYVWKAAWAFHKQGDPAVEEWVNERFLSILEGKSSTVAAGIRRSATNRKLSKENRKAIDTCATYLLNKTPYLKYNEYLAKGYPIATGIIEGACRHLIKDRMDRTGAKWSVHGAEAVLKLRSLKASGDFTKYWEFHEQEEFKRNHESKYKNKNLIKKAPLTKIV